MNSRKTPPQNGATQLESCPNRQRAQLPCPLSSPTSLTLTPCLLFGRAYNRFGYVQHYLWRVRDHVGGRLQRPLPTVWRYAPQHHHFRWPRVRQRVYYRSKVYEFVREVALNRNYEALPTYFPHDDLRGIRDRWKEVLKKLCQDGKIKAIPDFGQDPVWEEFRKLVFYRNGLIHAKASRPATSTQKSEDKPLPSPEDLDRLPAGWAVKTVG